MIGRLTTTGGDDFELQRDKIAAIVRLARGWSAPGGHGAAAERLCVAVKQLSDDEQAILLALVRIGEARFAPEFFDAALTEAFQQRSHLLATYIAGLPGLADMLEAGAAACTMSGAANVVALPVTGRHSGN